MINILFLKKITLSLSFSVSLRPKPTTCFSQTRAKAIYFLHLLFFSAIWQSLNLPIKISAVFFFFFLILAQTFPVSLQQKAISVLTASSHIISLFMWLTRYTHYRLKKKKKTFSGREKSFPRELLMTCMGSRHQLHSGS